MRVTRSRRRCTSHSGRSSRRREPFVFVPCRRTYPCSRSTCSHRSPLASPTRTLPEGTATPGNSNDYKTIYTYYPNSGLVQSKTTPLGRSTTFTYTKDQKVLTKTDPGGNVTNYAYYTDGRIWKITSPAPVSAVTQYKYDNAGRPTQIIDPTGVSSKTVYSTATGLPTAVIGPRGTAAGANQATIDAATTTLSYGKDGQLTQESTPNPGGDRTKGVAMPSNRESSSTRRLT